MPGFIEKVIAQPERSPLVDDALCPTFLDFKRLAEAHIATLDEAPPVDPVMARMWALCDARSARTGPAEDAGWAPPAGGWDAPPAGGDDQWYSPPMAAVDDDPAAKR